MLLKSSYNTSHCQASPHTKIEQALKQALVSGYLSEMNFGISGIGNCKAVFVSGINPDENTIPPFIHPYLIGDFKGTTYLVTDIRAYKATTQLYPNWKDFEQAIRNKSEYTLIKNRAALELRWVSGEVTKIRSQLSFAGSVYGSWIAQSLSKVYALDLHDQLRVTAIAMYYYHTLFTANKKLDDQELEIAVIHTIKATKLPAQEVYALFNKISDVAYAEDLCAAIRDGLENVRLRDFSTLMLLTMLKNSWYGNNAKDIIATAIEYPPAWISIVYAALTEKTYRNSPVYKLVEIQAKRTANVEEFKSNYEDLLDSILVLESIDNTEIVFKDF